MTWNEIYNHSQTIYLMAIHAELTSEGFYKDGSEYRPPHYAKDYGYGKSPSDFAADIIIKHGDLLNAFNDFTGMPDPASFDGPIEQLETMCTHLSVDQYVDADTKEAFTGNGLRGEISYLEKNLPSWRGRAAEKFNENYLSKLPDKASSQWALAYTLLCFLRAEQELWKATQKDVDQVAHDTIDALLHGPGGTISKKAATVVSIFTTISAFIPVLNTAVGAVTAAGAVLSALDSLLPDEEDAAAYNPSATIADMYEALDAVRTEVRKKEQQICDDMRALEGKVSSHPTAFHLRRPALADGGFGSYDPD